MSARYAQDRSASAPVTAPPFQIRGRFLTAITLRLETEAADAAFYDTLDAQLAATPHFFADAPMVIDFGKVAGFTDSHELRDLVEQLRRRKLRVFGMLNAEARREEVLRPLGLIPIVGGRDAPGPRSETGRARRVEKLLPPDNKIVTTPVRSGQTVVAERGDLTVIGSVASGAELIASGNIHVYGPLRGRAMAGVQGDASARIFCQTLDAELVAIAGLYQTSDTIEQPVRNRCTHIFLEDDRLRMEPIA